MDQYYNPRSAPSYGNPYLFTGRRLDILDNGSLKLQYNRNRYYDYYTGRWLTHDPLGITPNPQWPNVFHALVMRMASRNLYEYGDSRPITFEDWSGLDRDVPELDLDSLWGVIRLTFPPPASKYAGCGEKCSITALELKEVRIKDKWASGTCPPLTQMVVGWLVSKEWLERRITRKFPIDKRRECGFPCAVCNFNMASGWRAGAIVGNAKFKIPNASITGYWGLDLRGPGFSETPNWGRRLACDFHFSVEMAISIFYRAGACVSPHTWLDEPYDFF